MKQLSFKKAKKYSLIKWNPIRKYGFNNAMKRILKYKKYKIIRGLRNNCGFCERWFIQEKEGIQCFNCSQCEYNQGFQNGCFNSKHTYYKFKPITLKQTEMKIADIIYKQIEVLKPTVE